MNESSSSVIDPENGDLSMLRSVLSGRQHRSGAPSPYGQGVLTGRVTKNQSQARFGKTARGHAADLNIGVPCSVLTKDSTVPLVDVEAFVRRSTEVRQAEAKEKDKIPRPENPFFLYRRAYNARLRELCQGGNHSIVSSACGAGWAHEPQEVRDVYRDLAEIDKANHKIAFPDWRYSPLRKNTWLANWNFVLDDQEAESAVKTSPSKKNGKKSSTSPLGKAAKMRKSPPSNIDTVTANAPPQYIFPQPMVHRPNSVVTLSSAVSGLNVSSRPTPLPVGNMAQVYAPMPVSVFPAYPCQVGMPSSPYSLPYTQAGCQQYFASPTYNVPVQTPVLPFQNLPFQPLPFQSLPFQPLPFQSLPLQASSSQPLPLQPLPSQPLPSQPLLDQTLPLQPLLDQPVPLQPLLDQPVPSQSLLNQPLPLQSVQAQSVPSQSFQAQPTGNHTYPSPMPLSAWCMTSPYPPFTSVQQAVQLSSNMFNQSNNSGQAQRSQNENRPVTRDSAPIFTNPFGTALFSPVMSTAWYNISPTHNLQNGMTQEVQKANNQL